MEWANKYIGIPYRSRGRHDDEASRKRLSLDCWGLLRLVYHNEVGIDLPSYSEHYDDAGDVRATSRLVSSHEDNQLWTLIPSGKARPFDGAMIRLGNATGHVGIIVGWFSNRLLMLHLRMGYDSAIERLDSPAWRERLVGIYRHECLYADHYH